MKSYTSLLILFFAALPSSVLAADLNGCIALAEKNSTLLSAYENKLAANAADYEKDRGAAKPQVSGAAGASYSRYGDESDLENGFSAQLGVAVNWDLEKYFAESSRSSRLELEKTGLLKAMAENEIAKNIAADYHKLHVLSLKKADYAAAIQYFENHLADIKKLLAAGLDLKLDLIRATIQQKSLRASFEDVQGDINNSLLAINSATGGNFGETDFVFADVPLPQAQPEVAASSANYTAQAAAFYQSRLDGLETKTAEEAYRQSKYNYTPALQLGVDRNIHSMDPNTEQYRGYVALNFNIFDYGQRAKERESLQKTLAYQKYAARDNFRKLVLSMAQLAQEIQTSANACRHAAENLNDAAASLETANTYYRQGKIKETDLLSIFSEYFDAKQKSRDALGQYLAQTTELDYLLKGSAQGAPR